MTNSTKAQAAHTATASTPHLFCSRLTFASPFLSFTCDTPSSIYYSYGLPTAALFPPSPPFGRLPSPCSAWLCVFIPFLTFITSLIFSSPDFQVTYPTKGAQVANGQTIPVTWIKGLLDGVDFFDLELTRMSTDGLTLVARSSGSQLSFLHCLFFYNSPPLPFPPCTSFFIK